MYKFGFLICLARDCYICTLIVNEVNDVQDRSACDVY